MSELNQWVGAIAYTPEISGKCIHGFRSYCEDGQPSKGCTRDGSLIDMDNQNFIRGSKVQE